MRSQALVVTSVLVIAMMGTARAKTLDFVDPTRATSLPYGLDSLDSPPGSDVEVILKSTKGNRWAATIFTSSPPLGKGMSCGGRIGANVVFARDGEAVSGRAEQSYSATINLPNAFYTPGSSLPAQSAKNCTVKLSIEGKSISVEEGDGCMAFHGASCDFNSNSLMLWPDH